MTSSTPLTRDAIAAMPLAEFEAREQDIDAWLLAGAKDEAISAEELEAHLRDVGLL